MIKAEIIADSKSPSGDRITTFLLVFPRIVLAEFNTHRVLSRNSASSRAIPFEKMLKKVEESPFIPRRFQKDHSGMQGTEYFEGEELEKAKGSWLKARTDAIVCATELSRRGITKQLCNRLLEPFMYHTVIVTATEWENFFALRAHPAAEIHIAHLAELMLEAYNTSTPKELRSGEWHIPFGDQIDEEKMYDEIPVTETLDNLSARRWVVRNKVKIATARCARVSYENYEGGDDYAKDIKLHDRLSSLGHWSPFEHCAQALAVSIQSGNFVGWEQYRKQFANENQPEDRVIKK